MALLHGQTHSLVVVVVVVVIVVVIIVVSDIVLVMQIMAYHIQHNLLYKAVATCFGSLN